jgi:DNA-directed RNA polymerase subunit K/omega
MNAFELVVVSSLRVAQLNLGCTPRVERSPKIAVTAQHEVAARKVLPVRAGTTTGAPPKSGPQTL